MESTPKPRDAKKEEWESIEHAIEQATADLPATTPDEEFAHMPVRDITLQSLEVVQEYMKANDAVLSQPQKNLLLAHLRAKKFNRDNHIN